MQINLPADMEARLNQLATESGRCVDQVAQEMLAKQLDYDAWFRARVAEGIASLDAGEWVSHEEVERRLAKVLDE